MNASSERGWIYNAHPGIWLLLLGYLLPHRSLSVPVTPHQQQVMDSSPFKTIIQLSFEYIPVSFSLSSWKERESGPPYGGRSGRDKRYVVKTEPDKTLTLMGLSWVTLRFSVNLSGFWRREITFKGNKLIITNYWAMPDFWWLWAH